MKARRAALLRRASGRTNTLTRTPGGSSGGARAPFQPRAGADHAAASSSGDLWAGGSGDRSPAPLILLSPAGAVRMSLVLFREQLAIRPPRIRSPQIR